MNINPGTPLPPVAGLSGSVIDVAAGSGQTETSFADVLGSAIGQVETSHKNAQTAAMDLLYGGQGDVHSVALASQRAALSLELFQQVRNKFVSAYQEIMKMPM